MSENFLENLLVPGTLTFLTGDPESGKTTFLTALIYTATTGRTFLNQRLERGLAHWFNDNQTEPDRQRLLDDVPETKRVQEFTGVPDLATDEGIQDFKNHCQTHPARYIVIDSMKNAPVHLIQTIAAQTGAAIIVIQNQSRALPNVNVCELNADQDIYGRLITLELKRNGRRLIDPLLIFSSRPNNYEPALAKDRNWPVTTRDRILDHLTKNGASTVRDLRSALKVSRETVNLHLRILTQHRKAIVIGKSARSKIYARCDQSQTHPNFALQTAIPIDMCKEQMCISSARPSHPRVVAAPAHRGKSNLFDPNLRFKPQS